MASETGIAWTDSTFNPWMGCTKVSEGCAHCYAERDTKRYGRVIWGDAAPRIRTSADYWKQPLAWQRQAEASGTRRRVFCASLADVFEDRPELAPWREDLFALIEKTPRLDWQLLTKRPENMVRMTAHRWKERWPENVWAGATTENQTRLEERVGHLLAVPARVRFLSCEPLLGPLSIDTDRTGLALTNVEPRIHWVIVGGESGPQAQPMHPDWARLIREQCDDALVPFFFKQWGEWAPRPDLQGAFEGKPAEQGRVHALGDRVRVVNLAGGHGFHGERPVVMEKVGKKAAGDLLDGVRCQAFPVGAA
jgi:protein gp37